ncbi:acyl-CoA dehydrogenase family protein [Gordonia iterans]
MDFRLDSLHDDLAQTVAAITARSGGVTVARAWADGDHAPGLAVYRALAEAGITGLLVDDDLGGSGAGAVEMVVAVEQLGRACLPGPVAETFAVVPALLSDARLDDELLALLSGKRLATCAAPPRQPRAADPDDSAVYLVTDDGLFRGRAGTALPTVDPTRCVAAVEPAAPIVEPATSMAEPATSMVEPVEPARARPCRNHLDLGALATAAQSLGLASAMLEIAADYAKARHQFGRAIGEFQAVKHHLADVAIAVEMARPLIWGAAVTGDRLDVSAAKVAASDAADLAARRSLQVLGAIGYTAEHDLSLYLTKARALRSAWGTPAWHRQRILEDLSTSSRGETSSRSDTSARSTGHG